MKIRKNVMIFNGTSLVQADLDENGRIVSGNAPDPKPAAPKEGPTKQEAMAMLKAKGITFKATLSTAALLELLNEEPPEPAVEQGGTGNQNVI